MSKNLHDEFRMYAFHEEALQQIETLRWSARRAEGQVHEMQWRQNRFMSLFPDYVGGGTLYQCRIMVDKEMVKNMVGNMSTIEKYVLDEFRHLVQIVFEGKDAGPNRLE